ncbi:MAG: tyrosine-type recombinase/integrase [Actinobacteria bacterium]|nr:tyrosine-type recombinase/integrase [Actinomycetota bacterium]
MTALHALNPASTYVFETMYAVRPASVNTFTQWHYRIQDAAGLERSGYHRLRHSFATAALDVSGDLRAVQELLGHASPTTTAIYTKVRQSKLQDVVDRLYEAAPLPEYLDPGGSARGYQLTEKALEYVESR